MICGGVRADKKLRDVDPVYKTFKSPAFKFPVVGFSICLHSPTACVEHELRGHTPPQRTV